MLEVELTATTNVPDDTYVFAKWLFLSESSDDDELMSIKMFDSFIEGHVSGGRLYVRADACDALSRYGDELSDQEALSLLIECPIDAEIDISLGVENVNDFSLSNPKIVISSDIINPDTSTSLLVNSIDFF